MKIFIDTADVEAIRRAKAMGFVSGVTTNPSLIAAEGKDFHTVIKEIASIVDGPVSAEVLSETAEEMIAEGQVLAGLDPHVVVKIPMTGEGIKAVSALSDMGIRSNVTLIFSAGQALLAARAGASYVSPFVGRIDDIGWDGVELIRTIADIFRLHKIKTEIIAASVRKPRILPGISFHVHPNRRKRNSFGRRKRIFKTCKRCRRGLHFGYMERHDASFSDGGRIP